MQSSAPPFIGVSGIANHAQIQSLQSQIDPRGARRLMAALAVDCGTFHASPLERPTYFPRMSEIPAILEYIDPAVAFGLVHINSFDSEHLEGDVRTVFNSTSLTALDRGEFRGFLNDVRWPGSTEMWAAHRQYRGRYSRESCRSVLRLDAEWMAIETKQVEHRVGGYYDYASDKCFPFAYVLIDIRDSLSGEPDWKRAVELVGALLPFTADEYSLKLGVTGGLTAVNLDQLQPVLELYPELSMSVDETVRDADDRLDLDLALDFVQAAVQLLA